MTTWSQFRSDIDTIIGYGGSVDDLISLAARQAGQSIEARHSFKYMERVIETVLQVPGSTAELPARVDIQTLAGAPIRNIIEAWVHLPGSPRERKSFFKIDYDDYERHEGGEPKHYVQVNEREIQPVEIIAREWVAKFYVSTRTQWGDLEDNAEPWLVNYGNLAMTIETIRNLGPAIRDDGLVQRYAQLWPRAWEDLMVQDSDMRNEGRDDQMPVG